MGKSVIAITAALVMSACAARADQGRVSNVHVGLGSQAGQASGGCVSFDLVRSDATSARYSVGNSQEAGWLYQEAILTHDGAIAGLDPGAVIDCPFPSFGNLNFPPKPGQ